MTSGGGRGGGPMTTTKPWANEPTLSRPLYVFDLPSELASSLHVRNAAFVVTEDDTQSTTTTNDAKHTSGCALCPSAPSFRSTSEKRAHIRSDWHRYNAGLSRRGQQEDALSEEAFVRLIEELSSGSEAESEDDDDESRENAPVDTVSTLLARLRLNGTTQAEESSEEEYETRNAAVRESHVWFVTPAGADKVVEQTQFGVVRQVIESDMSAGALARMQPAPLTEESMRSARRFKGAKAADEAASMLGVVFMDGSGETDEITEENVSIFTEAPAVPLKTWTIILLGGGNFSAVVVALNPFERAFRKSSERQLLVVARKQFHRYTTRRKQGGSQSAQDATGRIAKSAGSSLRRYGEQQLGEEIRALLDSAPWRTAIESSECVWIRAGLRSARGVLWGWNTTSESPLEEVRKRDRMRTLPIATRKPNVGECLRCFAELTRVRVRHETTEELEERDASALEQENGRKAREERRRQKKVQSIAAKPSMSTATASLPKLEPLEQLRRERVVRLIDMLRKGRVESAVRHLDKYEAELFPLDEDVTHEPDDVDEAMALARRRINAPLPHWWRLDEARERGVSVASAPTRQHLIPSTLLQVAAEGGHARTIAHLLVERQADPTQSVAPPPPTSDADVALDEDGAFPHRTAYDLCPSAEARDVFRRQMAAEPMQYDWSGTGKGGARVPKALTEEKEGKRQLMRERAQKRLVAEAHTITEQDRQEATAVVQQQQQQQQQQMPRALQKQRDEAAGLTPEMRARIEREKRARAAEARMKASM